MALSTVLLENSNKLFMNQSRETNKKCKDQLNIDFGMVLVSFGKRSLVSIMLFSYTLRDTTGKTISI